MTNSWRGLLVVIVLLSGLFLALGCGDDNGNGDGDGDGAEATEPMEDGDATEAPSDGDGEATEQPSDGDGEGAGSFGDIPVPSGAEETESGSFTSSQVPFLDPTGEIDPDAYTNLEFRLYEVDGSAEDALDFYRDELSDWDEAYVFSGGAAGEGGGFGIWTSDGAALWVGASESEGTTELTLIYGTQE